MKQKSSRDQMLKEIIDKNKFLTKKSNFDFKCNTCGRCCFNQDIILNTYDLLRLRREFEEPTMLILNKYCQLYPGPQSKMPVCLLKFIKILNQNTTVCPFLKPEFYKELENLTAICDSEEEFKEKARKIIEKNTSKTGDIKSMCSIHKNSPEVCKLYPLGRGLIFDKKGKNPKTKYFKISKNKLLCDRECFQHKGTVEEYLKNNNLIDPEKEKLGERYNTLIMKFANLTMKYKEKFTDFNLLTLYLQNFDLLFVLQAFRKSNIETKKKVINQLKLAHSSIDSEKVILDILGATKKIKSINQSLAFKSLLKQASEEDLKKFFKNLLSIYDDLLLKLKEKYAKKT